MIYAAQHHDKKSVIFLLRKQDEYGEDEIKAMRDQYDISEADISHQCKIDSIGWDKHTGKRFYR
jgi:hypothetical protein